MLLLLVSWGIILLACIPYGYALSKVTEEAGSDDQKKSLSLIFLLGLASVSCIVSWFSLAVTIGPAMLAAILLGSVLIMVSMRGEFQPFVQYHIDRFRRLHWSVWGILLALLMLCLYFSAGPILVYDTGLYHAQSIQWAESYPVVKGLGNLHGRLAFNCHSFLLDALFRRPFMQWFGLNAFYPLCGLLFFWLSAFCTLTIIKSFRQGPFALGMASALIIFFTWFLFPIYVSSPWPDLVLASILLLLFLVTTRTMVYQGRTPSVATLIIISAFAMTVKLSALMILILPLAVILNRGMGQFQGRQWMLFAACFLVMVSPFFARNVLLSGYLVYPFELLDIFQFDWKVPTDMVINERKWIKSWALVKSADADLLLSKPLPEQYRLWFQSLSFNPRALILSGITGLSTLVAVFLYRKNRSLLPIVASLVIMSAFWILSAPDVRFNYAPLIFSAGFGISLLFNFNLFSRLAGIALAGLCLYVAVRSIPYHTDKHPYTLAEVILQPKELFLERFVYTTEQLNSNVSLLVPDQINKTNRCNDEALPCAPDLNPQLVLREDELSKGFRMNSH